MNQPLSGHTFINTRARAQAAELSRLLIEQGARVIELPLLTFGPPDDLNIFERVVKNLQSGDWLFFTSANGVRFFTEGLRQIEFELSADINVAAVGDKTAHVCKSQGYPVSFVPREANGEALAREFVERYPDVGRFHLFRGNIASPEIVEVFSQFGQVHDVVVYESKQPRLCSEGNTASVKDFQRASLIVVTSSQVVRHLSQLEKISTPLAVLGPKTLQTAKEFGFSVAVVAKTPSMESLVFEIVKLFSK